MAKDCAKMSKKLSQIFALFYIFMNAFNSLAFGVKCFSEYIAVAVILLRYRPSQSPSLYIFDPERWNI